MPSYGASVQISDTAIPGIRAVASALASAAYRPAVGEAAKLVLTDHLAAKNNDGSSHKTASRLGAQQQNLYAQFVRATSWSNLASGIRLSISHAAARQRIEGGTITPVNGKYLTIPAIAGAYGKRARECGTILKFLFRRISGEARPVALISEQTGSIWYWLVKSVTQAGDDTVLPTDQQFVDGVTNSLSGWIRHRFKAGGANA